MIGRVRYTNLLDVPKGEALLTVRKPHIKVVYDITLSRCDPAHLDDFEMPYRTAYTHILDMKTRYDWDGDGIKEFKRLIEVAKRVPALVTDLICHECDEVGDSNRPVSSQLLVVGDVLGFVSTVLKNEFLRPTMQAFKERVGWDITHQRNEQIKQPQGLMARGNALQRAAAMWGNATTHVAEP